MHKFVSMSPIISADAPKLKYLNLLVSHSQKLSLQSTISPRAISFLLPVPEKRDCAAEDFQEAKHRNCSPTGYIPKKNHLLHHRKRKTACPLMSRLSFKTVRKNTASAVQKGIPAPLSPDRQAPERSSPPVHPARQPARSWSGTPCRCRGRHRG